MVGPSQPLTPSSPHNSQGSSRPSKPRLLKHNKLKLNTMLTLFKFGIQTQVADFGLSRMLDSSRTHLSTRAFGTVSHCPPELLHQGQLRPAGDVYALGIMRE